MGLGVVAGGARTVTDEMFSAAAWALADQVTEEDMAAGRIYPTLSRIREVSLGIAEAVARVAYREGLADHPEPADVRQHIRDFMFTPEYTPLV